MIPASGQWADAQVARRLTQPQEFTVDQWTTVDGLPQNSVNAVAQTPDGYIWVGTFGGLARFDGIRFEPAERIDGAGHHVDRVLALAVAPDSSLWIGTENGLLQYRAGRFKYFSRADGLPDSEIRALLFDHTGDLWIGTERGGAARYRDGRFVTFGRAEGEPFDEVSSLVEDRTGVIWLNSRGRYFTIEHGNVTAARPKPFTDPGYQHMLLQDRDGSRWFLMKDGLARIGSNGAHRFQWGYGPEIMIEQPVQGRYWLGTFGNGVLEFRPEGSGRTHTYALGNGDTTYGTKSLLDAHDGNVWAGTTSNGLLRLKKNLFSTYRRTNGLSHDVTTAVMESRDGSLWVGTNCGGLDMIDPARRSIRSFKTGKPGVGSDPCIYALTQDSAGVMWVGTYGGGLTRIENGLATRVGGLSRLRDSTILALFTDRSGTVWVGTGAAGLAAVKDGRIRRVYTTADGLAHDNVRAITQTRDGAIWIGTLEGLSRLDAAGKFTNYTSVNGLSSEYVRAIYEDADDKGTLWVGTYGGGLNRLRNGTITPITRAAGLPDNVVSSILDDGLGNLWMSGNRGISRVAKDQLNGFADGTLSRVHSVLYGVADGLVKAETNGGFQPAAWKDHSGRLWFPTIDGVASVDPRDATDIPRPPSVSLGEILVDGATMSPARSLEVGPGRPNVEFRYGAVSLSSPDNVTFRYRLEHFDEHWVEPGTRRVAYYSRLPAGRYRFVVTAANRDGTWNPAEASMDVVVLAPLVARPWFLAVMSFVLALSLWAAHRTVLRTRSAAIREERSRLAREIHDSLLQGFGGIALQLHAASTRLSLSPAQQPTLDRVLTMIDRTLKQAREAVWDIRLQENSSADLVIDCEQAAPRAVAGCDTEVRVIATGRQRRLSHTVRTECLRIVEEALSNVRKHAAARHAVVEIHFAWQSLLVTITDDGRGFDPEREAEKPGHWGWLGMRERASRIGGRVSLTSRIGAGTVVVLRVPYYMTWLSMLARQD
jgi:ligand-binding sensor domain-containing protein/signal transduction histidine kinase